jgi:hypothetical protein
MLDVLLCRLGNPHPRAVCRLRARHASQPRSPWRSARTSCPRCSRDRRVHSRLRGHRSACAPITLPARCHISRRLDGRERLGRKLARCGLLPAPGFVRSFLRPHRKARPTSCRCTAPRYGQLLKTPRASCAAGWKCLGALNRRAAGPSGQSFTLRGRSAANRSIERGCFSHVLVRKSNLRAPRSRASHALSLRRTFPLARDAAVAAIWFARRSSGPRGCKQGAGAARNLKHSIGGRSS